EVNITKQLDCRYVGQGYELSIDVNEFAENWKEIIQEKFDKKHNETYGFSFEGNPIELINIRVNATGKGSDVPKQRIKRSETSSIKKPNTGKVIFGNTYNYKEYSTPLYDRGKL